MLLRLALATVALFTDAAAPRPGISEPRLNTPFLLLHNEASLDSEGGKRLLGLLDGLGIPYRHQAIEQLQRLQPDQHQTVIVLSGFLQNPDQKLWLNDVLKQSLRQGTHVIYLGASFCANADPELQSRFGITLDSSACVQTVAQQGVREVTLAGVGLAGRSLTLYPDEVVLRLPPASRLATPLLVTQPNHSQEGGATLVGFDILSYWKHPLSNSSYARALLLTRLLNRSLADGYVAKHASMHGLQAPLLMRWEDVAPLSDRSPQGPMVQHLDRFKRLLAVHQLPLNIAIVSRYVNPSKGVLIRWSDQHKPNLRLRRFVADRLRQGGSLIAHGHTHQFGTGADDISNLDGEMWDEDADAYLSRAEQILKVDAAVRELRMDWGRRPLIWETPHYKANRDTFAAVAQAGFKAVVESDSSVFPNRYGYDDQLDPRLLNVPETGFEIPWDAMNISLRLSIWRGAIQPDLHELGAPFLFFYHGHSVLQLDALTALLEASGSFSYWKPSLDDYIQFWERRHSVDYRVVEASSGSKFTILVDRGFAGMTMRIRLPDGHEPQRVSVDSLPGTFLLREFDGIAYVYVVLPGDESSIVEVSHRPRTVP